MGTCLVLGVVAGLLWTTVAPRARYQVQASGVLPDARTSQAPIAADGWLAVLCVGAGVLAALVSYLGVRRRGGQATGWLLAGLLLGGLGGGLVAWRLGTALAPDRLPALAAGHPPGSSFRGGLRLRAAGVLVLWPTVSVALLFGLVAGFERPAQPGVSAGGRAERSPPA